MIFCDLCKISFPNHSTWNGHLSGKKHVLLLSEKQSAERSVFVTGFHKSIKETVLRNYFSQFGGIKNLIFDKKKSIYAIVEFESKQFALKALQKKHSLQGSRLVVKPRRPKKNRESSKRQTTDTIYLDDDQIFEMLKTSPSGDEQMVLLTNTLKLCKEEIDERQKISEYFNNLFLNHFTFAEVNLFGSSVNGLGMHGCDVDLLLSLKPESDDSEKRSFAEKSDKKVLHEVSTILYERTRKIRLDELMQLAPVDIIAVLVKYIVRRRATNCSQILVIPSKRCPIVRFKIGLNQLSCDLSIKNRLSLYNSKLIHFYLNMDPRVQPLIFTIRYWAKRQQLAVDTSNRLTSYAVTMLVIYYLQNITPALLPTVEVLKNSSDVKCTQGGWECGFCDDQKKIPPSENSSTLTELFKGFLSFYNSFDFENEVVCLCNGKSETKENVKSNVQDFKISRISVQDPFDLSHNITGNVSETLACEIIEAFASSANQANSENIWIPSQESPWGIAALFELQKPGDKIEPNTKRQKVQHKSPEKTTDSRQPTEEQETPKLKFNIFSSFEVEQFRKSLPSTSQPNSSSDEGWFHNVCEAVKSIFAVGLQFKCQSANFNSTNGKKLTPDESLSSDTTGSEANENGCKTEACVDQFSCQVAHRTWVNRKKVKSTLKRPFDLKIVQVEEMVSRYLIENSDSGTNLPVLSFQCRIEMTPNSRDGMPEVNLTLQPFNYSPELTGSLFIFLQSYIPKLMRQMQTLHEM